MIAAPTVDRLTREILHYEDLAVSHAANALKFKVEIGQRLIQAKQLMPPGKFVAWASASFHWDRRHIARHMLLAKHAHTVSHLPPDASLRMALAAIGPTNGKPVAKPEHVRFELELDEESSAVIEVKRGDPDELARAFEDAALVFRRIEKA